MNNESIIKSRNVMKPRLFLIFAIFTITPCFCFSFEYFTNRDKNTIERMGGWGENAIPVKGRVHDNLQFDPSPSGLLMYVEDLTTGPVKMAGNERLKIHIVDSKGQDRYTVCILQPENSLNFGKIPDAWKAGRGWNHGRFLTDTLVMLSGDNRRAGTLWVTLVDAKRAVAHEWDVTRVASGEWMEIGKVAVSPDGLNYTLDLSLGQDNRQVLFLNGNLVYPFYDDNPPRYFGRSPVNKANPLDWNVFKAMFSKYPCAKGFRFDPKTVWSDDGRYLSLVEQMHCDDSLAGTTVTQPSILILDTLKTGPGKDYRDYGYRVPLTLSDEKVAQLKGKIDPNEEPGAAKPSPYALIDAHVNTREGVVTLTSRTDPPQPLGQIKLPSDWREKTIRPPMAAPPKD